MKIYNMIIRLLITFFLVFPSLTLAENANQPQVITGVTAINADNLIEAKLRTIYNLNPALSKYNIKVSAAEGVVDIDGAVSNTSEKELAEQLAKMVDDVKEIRNNLNVDRQVKTGDEYSSWGEKISDATITTLLKSRLLLDPRTSALNVNIETINSIVTLKGTVKTPKEKRLIGEIAAQVPGVVAVKNYLKTGRR